ncbi:MAG: hypothetical protein AAFX40_19020, partial [Cyanobacteria bacterium J06639_1]
VGTRNHRALAIALARRSRQHEIKRSQAGATRSQVGVAATFAPVGLSLARAQRRRSRLESGWEQERRSARRLE